MRPTRRATELDNAVNVDSATPDSVDDNSATDAVTPTDEVDLSVAKSHTGAVEIGEQLTFTIDVPTKGLPRPATWSSPTRCPTG